MDKNKHADLKRVILAPTNIDMHRLNKEIVGALEGLAHMFNSEDTVDNYDIAHIYQLPSGI